MKKSSFRYDREKEGWFLTQEGIETPFCPLICSTPTQSDLSQVPTFNTHTISVDVGEHARLDFEGAFQEATRLKEAGKWVLWNLNFSFHENPLRPGDESQFNALKFSLLEFKAKLLESFKNETFGVCLFEDKPSFDLIEYSLKLHGEYLTWLEKRKEHSPSLNTIYQTLKPYDQAPNLQSLLDLQPLSKWSSLFISDLLLNLFHYLIASLDEETPILVFLKSDEVDPVGSALLFTQERFEYIEPLSLYTPSSSLGINTVSSKGYYGIFEEEAQASLRAFKEREEVTLGLLFPESLFIHDHALEELNALLKQLSEEKVAFRLISERFFTELWQGLDQVVVHPKLLSRSGIRKLHGFCAAQGEIILLEPSSESYASSCSFIQWQKKYSIAP